jgi:hypothetical protein
MQNRRKRIADLKDLIENGGLGERDLEYYKRSLQNELNEQRRMNK